MLNIIFFFLFQTQYKMKLKDNSHLLHDLRRHPAWRPNKRLPNLIPRHVSPCGQKGTHTKVCGVSAKKRKERCLKKIYAETTVFFQPFHIIMQTSKWNFLFKSQERKREKNTLPAICTEPSSPRRMFPALRSLVIKSEEFNQYVHPIALGFYTHYKTGHLQVSATQI